MLRRCFFILMTLLISFSGDIFAQNKLVLNIEQSVQIALEKNPEIKMAEKEEKKAKADVWEAYSAILPMVDASVNLVHSWEIQTSRVPNFLKPILSPLAPLVPEFDNMPDYMEFAFGLENTLTYGATLNQPLFLGGAGIAGIQLANATRKASQYDLEFKRQNLIFQTTNAFYGCLLARELVQVQEEALEQAMANLDIVLKKYEVGSASGFEKMRAEVEVANLKPEVIAARNNHQAALTGFRTILGLPSNTNIDLQGDLEYVVDDMSHISLEDLQAQAMSSRPDVHGLASQKTMVRKGICLARSEFLPKLFFSTDYSFLGMRDDLKFIQDDFSKGFTSTFSLQIPLFHGFKSHKRLQKAKLDYKIMLDMERFVWAGVAAEVEISYNKFKESTEKYQAARESISLAEEALRLANLMYEEGASTQLDVLSSQLALTQSRLNYASALYESQMARYELRRVTGTLKVTL